MLPLTLFGFGVAFSSYQVLSNPNNIKDAFSESGIYQVGVTGLLGETQSDLQDQIGEGSLPANDPAVDEAINQAISPSLLQAQIDKAVDNSYAWVQGDTDNLSLKLDLSEAKGSLANYLSDYAVKRAASLPTCTNIAEISSGFDPLNAPCKPPGVNDQVIADQAKQQILASNFFSDSTFDISQLKDAEGTPLSDRLQGIPPAYERIVLSMYVSAGLAIAMALVIILLSRPRRAGAQRVSVIALVIGILSTILAWLSSFVVNVLVDALSKTESETIQVKIIEIVRFLLSDLRSWWMGYGVALMVCGIASLVIMHVTAKRLKVIKPPENQMPPAVVG